MAHISRGFYEPTGRISWTVRFRKRVYGKNREVKKSLTYSATFNTEAEAIAFADEYEHIFFLQVPGEIEYDSLMARRKRRFRHKIKEKTVQT